MDNLAAEAELLALLEAEDYDRSEQSLSHFFKAAWPVLEPGKEYLHNWHYDAIAEYLEAVRLGQIRKLIVNMPPRYGKSLTITVCFPVWMWLKDPTKRFLCASYSSSLSIKHNLDRRQLIRSPWFQRAWSDRFELSDEQDQKSEFMNDHRGHMVATSVGGTSTGKGGDILITDDPLNPLMAASDIERDSANTWYDQTWSTRLDNKKTGVQIVVMQRLHEKDLTGHLMAKGGWETLKLEGEATKKTIIVLPVSKREVVREEGEPLHPEREGTKELEAMKIALGSGGYQGQYQQDPRPSAGGFFHREWWKRYHELPRNITRKIQFWDTAQKPGISNDYSVCATWAETSTGFYLIDLWRKKVAFPQLEQAAKDLFYKHKPSAIVVEDKASGIQLIQCLEAETSLPVVKFEPGQKDKQVRAAGAQPTVQAGNAYLPEEKDWVEDFLLEHEKFPKVDHDDQVDTTSMMVDFFRREPDAPKPSITFL